MQQNQVFRLFWLFSFVARRSSGSNRCGSAATQFRGKWHPWLLWWAGATSSSPVRYSCRRCSAEGGWRPRRSRPHRFLTPIKRRRSLLMKAQDQSRLSTEEESHLGIIADQSLGTWHWLWHQLVLCCWSRPTTLCLRPALDSSEPVPDQTLEDI